MNPAADPENIARAQRFLAMNPMAANNIQDPSQPVVMSDAGEGVPIWNMDDYPDKVLPEVVVTAKRLTPEEIAAMDGAVSYPVPAPDIETRPLPALTTNNPGITLPEIEAQRRYAGGVTQAASMGWREALNPNNTWGQRLTFGGLSLAATPVAMVESLLYAPSNVVSAAGETGQYLARAGLQTDPAERNLDLLRAVVTGTEAFDSSLAWVGRVRPQAGPAQSASESAAARAT